MSEQVIKTVENVDKLFSQIIVNGETFISDKVVEKPKPVVKPSTKTETTTTTSTTPKASRTGEDVYAVDLNDVLHNFTDRTTKQNLTEEIRNRTEKDTAMQTELNTVKSSLNTVKASVEDIQALIPNQATKDNQLADKDFVNSSIATNTANFLGTFNTLEEIEALTDATNNDYAFWKTTDTLGSVVFKRYKYIADEQLWKYEYDLNNSSFTAKQWEAINSGITAEKVALIAQNATNIELKQNLLNENQLKAINSGITAEKVALIPNSAVAQIDDDSKDAMHAWSGAKVAKEIEFVDNKNNYSTEEKVIGKWIDGIHDVATKTYLANIGTIRNDWKDITSVLPEVNNDNMELVLDVFAKGIYNNTYIQQSRAFKYEFREDKKLYLQMTGGDVQNVDTLILTYVKK